MPEFYNAPLTAAVIAWFIAQLIKIFDYMIRNKKVSLERLWGAGGMPSSHSAAVCGLAAALGVTEGVGSPVFAVAVILALIVMYDASGVRRAAGMHAKEINKIRDIIEELEGEEKTGIESISDINKENIEEKKEHLKEFIGHSPVEVFFGALIGISAGLIVTTM
jgi:hypothetical protein